MEPATHSRIAIASFITSVAFGLLMVVAVLAARQLAAAMPGNLDETSAAAAMLGLCLAGSLVALRLGVGGISQEAGKKTFAVLGIVLSAATILGIGLIMAIGLGAK